MLQVMQMVMGCEISQIDAEDKQLDLLWNLN